jgi:hypothetical protein
MVARSRSAWLTSPTNADPCMVARVFGLRAAKQHPRAGMEEKRFLIPHEELTELHIERLNEGRDAEEIRSHLRNLRHDSFL